jgi:hypothetical protein
MAVLAYSEIVKHILGIEERKIEKYFIVLTRNATSPLRFHALRELAKKEKSTVGGILHGLKENRSGGTYISISKFFENLEKEGLLKKHKTENRTYWEFSENAKEFKEYLLRGVIGRKLKNEQQKLDI